MKDDLSAMKVQYMQFLELSPIDNGITMPYVHMMDDSRNKNILWIWLLLSYDGGYGNIYGVSLTNLVSVPCLKPHANFISFICKPLFYGAIIT